MAGADRLPGRNSVRRLEYKLQRELELSRTLRSGDISEVGIAGPHGAPVYVCRTRVGRARQHAARIKRTSRRPAGERPDRTVEGVERLRPELQPHALVQREVLVQAQINIEIAGPADVADRAGPEGAQRRIDHIAGIDPLNEPGAG